MSKRPFSRHSKTGTSLFEAFHFHVHPEPNSGCWLWVGPVFKQRGGYGAFTMRRANMIQWRAHRASWFIHCGEITPDAHVLHRCDNPACVNPDHLFLGDQASNMNDKVSKRRQNRGETHGRGKLLEAEALAILTDPRLYREIAADFGISIMTVSDIKRGRSWEHLPGTRHVGYRRAA